MKKLLPFLLTLLLLNTNSFSQAIIQGDKLLGVVGRPLTDPLCVQFRQQEDFLSEHWNRSTSVYTDLDSEKMITVIAFMNGKKRFHSEERYGIFTKQLPLHLKWTMTKNELEAITGSPDKTWPADVYDYIYGDWRIRAEFENGKLVYLRFEKTLSAVLSQKLGHW